MAMRQKQFFCKDCDKKTLHTKEMMGGGMGCLLTIITMGLFLPIWLLLDVFSVFRRWYCQACGRPRH